MSKQKKNFLVPWVVNPLDLMKWVQKEMPVKYKNKTMYLRPYKYDCLNDEFILLSEKIKRKKIESYMLHIAKKDDLTLLI